MRPAIAFFNIQLSNSRDTAGKGNRRLCYDRYNEGWGKKCTYSLWADIRPFFQSK